jgi:glycosyltransferase involved in cell wall biosynthesis
MRVALLVPAPFDTVSGGYGYDRAIVAGLRAAGHEVAVLELAGRHPLADDAARASAREAWSGLDAAAVPVIDGLGLPAFAECAGSLAARGAVGLIHHPTALEPGQDEATRNALRAIERELLPLLRRIIVTSAATADRVAAEFGVLPERIAIVEPGTATATRSAGSGGTGCAILAVGVLTPRKGHDILMRALARLPDLDWTLTIAGGPRDPEYAATLAKLADELRITPRVTLAGEVTGAALERLWQQADLFALATRFEGYGMAVAEALKRGLPAIVTDGGAAGKLLTPQTGVVARVDDVMDLSRSLRRVIMDRALRAAMADAAWESGSTLPDWPAQSCAFAAALAMEGHAMSIEQGGSGP